MLDTQLMVLLVIGATDQRLLARHRRTARKYTRADFNLLLDILGFDPRFVFCAPVAAETSNLVGQHGEPERSRMMNILKSLLNNGTEARIDCRSAIQDPSFVQLGLADAAQLALSTRDIVLLTDDRPLVNAALARGSTVIYFDDERQLRDQDRDP